MTSITAFRPLPTCPARGARYEEDANEYLARKVREATPRTHCCECTPGEHYDPQHFVHIQYPHCTCRPANYVLPPAFQQ